MDANNERRRKNNIVYNSYQYVTRRTSDTYRYVVCQNYRLTHCKASGKILLNGNGDFIALNNDHNHLPVQNEIRTINFKKELKEACIRQRGNLKEIYDQVALRHSSGALNAPYNSVRSSMLRWRQSTRPNVPRSLDELGNTLQLGTVSRDGYFAVIFGNTEFLQNFHDSEYTFIDGTFKAVPRQPNFGQILTIFATCMDHAFPVIHVFMQRRTRALYTATFEYIRDNFPGFVNGNVVTDYETALVESLRTAFPHVSLHGCFFHFCQAVFRKAKKLGIVRRIEGSVTGKNILRKYLALALLPVDRIEPALEILSRIEEFRQNFRVLEEYIRRQWVSRVTPQHFSVFRKRHRTNNVMESYHRRLNSKLVRHPGVWDLIETLIDIQDTALVEFQQLSRGGQVFRVAKKNAIFDARLNQAWDKLEDGHFTTEDFFRQAVHFVEALHLDLNNWEAAITDDDDEEPDLPDFGHLHQILNDPVPVRNPPIPVHIVTQPVLPIRLPINEPPPLIYFNNDEPVPPPVEYNAPSPLLLETSSPPPYSHSPLPAFNFGNILNDDDDDDTNEAQHRWIPTIPVTPFNNSMPEIIRCNVCLLNKIQYSLECGHLFCTLCAETLFNMTHPTCGICRSLLSRSPLCVYLN